MQEQIERKVHDFQINLNQWAREQVLIKIGESIAVTCSLIETSPDIVELLKMHPEAFFSKERFIGMHYSEPHSARAARAISKCLSQMKERGASLTPSLHELLSRYNSEKRLCELPQIRQHTARMMASSIREAGIPFD